MTSDPSDGHGAQRGLLLALEMGLVETEFTTKQVN